jgi:hypothetical protein
MITDDLKTAITVAEDCNRRRNHYRQEKPRALDPVAIDMQISRWTDERDKALKEIQEIFEKLINEGIVIEEPT